MANSYERRPEGRPGDGRRSPRPDGAGRPEGRRPEGGSRRPEGRRPEGRRPEGRRPEERNSRDYDRRPKNSRRGEGRQKSKGGKIALFIVEILVLAAMVFILWSVLKTEKVGKVDIPIDDIIINEEVRERLEMTSDNPGSSGESEAPSSMTGYRNIALFGVDSREGALTKNTRSDTIIIASVNEKTGEVKLCSVYRDTFLNLSNDQYNKCNAAYAKGGPKQAINMLNMNLDMNITDFVTIGFDGLIDVIDAMGGVEIDVKDSEIVHLNNYQISMVGKTTDGETFTANAGTDYTPVTKSGLQTLNGLQATAYCRIRYVGSDFQRAERQRAVIKALLEKAKANPSKLPSVAESLFSEVYTSLDLSEIITLLGDIAKYNIVDEAGFPQSDMVGVGNIGAKGSCVVPLDLYDNVKWLHGFLFGDTAYEPSSAVKSYSEKIKAETASHL